MMDATDATLKVFDESLGDPNETQERNDGAHLSDLDHALAHWARRHGADDLVAHAFALANWAVTQGHSCLTLNSIPAELMSRDNQAELPKALKQSDLVGTPSQVKPLIVDNNRLYLQRYHTYETRLAERLRGLMDADPEAVDIGQLEPGHGLFAADPVNPDATNWQAVAAFAALRHRFTVISGGPGTGKTYTIVRLLRVLIESAAADDREPPNIALAAPTGKAAARMIESVRDGLDEMTDFDDGLKDHVPRTARTLHRLLGLTGRSIEPRFHTDNPLPADVVIIDEASMVDLPLMAKLADAIGDGARLILLGDRYQLASVESGSVLAEICSHAGINQFSAAQQQTAGNLLQPKIEPADHPLADHVVTLQTSRRFNTDSAIGQLAAAVNAGDTEAADRILNAGHDDLYYHDNTDAGTMSRLMDKQANTYARLVEASDPEHALALLAKQCILTAVRGSPTGSQSINKGITERLARRFNFSPAARWYHGRPVLVTKNDYRTGLYNGDVGVALREGNGQLRVWFHGENSPRPFLPGALPEHQTVYAMTIHKSQGSEFKTVSLVLPEHDMPILSRELLYTGLTRARTQLELFANRTTLGNTINRRLARQSGLAERITRNVNQ